MCKVKLEVEPERFLEKKLRPNTFCALKLPRATVFGSACELLLNQPKFSFMIFSTSTPKSQIIDCLRNVMME